MNFYYENRDNFLFLHLKGDLIGENSGPEIMEVADGALKKEVKNCIINIEEVRFINSSGIGILITLLTKFRNKGGELYLINPSEQVNKLLIIIKLRNIFNIAGSEKEAIEKIK